MIRTVVRHLSRWRHRADTLDEPSQDEWADSDASCHNSSWELSSGLEVIEHFADTLPAFHLPPNTPQGWR